MTNTVFRNEDDLARAGKHGTLPARPTTKAMVAVVDRVREIRCRYFEQAENARNDPERLAALSRQTLARLDEIELDVGALAADATLAIDRDAAKNIACSVVDTRREIARDAGLPEADPLAAIAVGREVSKGDRDRVIL